jgi:acetyl esterase/lipase
MMRCLKGLMAMLLLCGCMVAKAQKLEEYLPEKATTTAVIVCPGGSYCWLSRKTEGSEVAEWLCRNGIAAYVLYYPTAGWAAFAWHTRWFYRGNQYPDQLQMLEKALRKVRAKGYRHVGAMGFSAGGHLVLTAAEYAPRDVAPDFIAPIYPVVTMSHPAVHHRSRRGLLGERRWKDAALCDSLSMERHAQRIGCPVFLMNCKDDPIVPPHNAELMDSALTALGKPHVYYEFAKGGHGFGTTAGKTSKEAISWMRLFLTWMHSILKD